MQLPSPDDIEKGALSVGLSIAAMCRKANLDATTFYRWRAGVGTPAVANVQKMLDAIEREGKRR